MLQNRLVAPFTQENPLWVSWHDSQLIPSLNPSNVMDYFSRKSNPFYDRVCNNETVRMQHMSLDQLNNMIGVEYILLHVAEPILYVIRKQHRHSPTEATPLADYYIIAGMIYKAPDLANVINSRILSTVTNLQSAFEEASNYSRYHPNKGYTWDFASNKVLSDKSKAATKKDASQTKDESGTIFQMQRVDMLLMELLRKFPPPIPPQIQQQQQQQNQNIRPDGQDGMLAIKQEPNTNNSNVPEASPTPVQGGVDIKVENVDMKPPPEKKIKLQ
ncbi:mediator of RNA polymerase II transcription subunit 6 [Episyrphus balteatus]|uniref:mediator of RNA polymerase II transcription subunit 6 n=1 Tax=Episyrphus balteatus TaxID=286459 RepID=UPI002485300E|nr:mediator of RNA polymerase II transcription subunit 6 [Episyrphus balteatus]XP_055848724.1 mediator of RNA polymerase II transcription subunit 6 [Episyrphus balteatus]